MQDTSVSIYNTQHKSLNLFQKTNRVILSFLKTTHKWMLKEDSLFYSKTETMGLGKYFYFVPILGQMLLFLHIGVVLIGVPVFTIVVFIVGIKKGVSAFRKTFTAQRMKRFFLGDDLDDDN